MLSNSEVENLMSKSKQLAAQSYDQISNIGPLSPCVISRQATLNIGTIGHVAHGKSTVVKAITTVNTVRHHKERIRNITIKLGYANAKIYKCPKCPQPQCYKSYPSNKEDDPKCINPGCSEIMQLLRHISFVDCPGHDVLMSTMLTGTAVMDTVFLLVAGDKDCPQPQTKEHLAAIEIVGLNHIVILQNKMDIVFREGKEAANKNYTQIKEFVKGTRAQNSPIIPISAQLGYNIDAVLQYIVDFIHVPLRDYTKPPRMMIIRSFDVNKPGDDIEKLKGGVAGGSILTGVLKVGDEIEIRPGIKHKDADGNSKCVPVFSKIVTLCADNNDLLYAVPGGLIAVGMTIDPNLTKADKLVGNVLGYPGHLPDVMKEIEIEVHLLRRLLGAKTEKADGERIRKPHIGETLRLNIGSMFEAGRVLAHEEKKMKVMLISPVCCSVGDIVAISRKIESWRLIGWGQIKSGEKCF